MNRRTVLISLGGAATAGLAGCLASGGRCSGEEYDVGMGDSAFEPERVTVSVGDTVRWLNTSGRAHTVTAYDDGQPEGADYFASGDFESEAAAREGWKDGEGAIYTCDPYEHTFETPGEHHYVCIPHERAGMKGTVVVEK
jgi:plastocyanin